MKKITLILILLILMPALIINAESKNRKYISFNGKDYQGPGYTLFEPSQWIKINGYGGFDIVLRDDNAQGIYKPNFGVMITARSKWQNWKSEWNKETSTSLNKNMLQQNLLKTTNGEIIDEYYDINLFWVMKLKHTQDLLPTGKIKAISLVAFTVQEGDSYMIQCNASEEDYQRYEVLFKEVIKSFKLNN